MSAREVKLNENGELFWVDNSSGVICPYILRQKDAVVEHNICNGNCAAFCISVMLFTMVKCNVNNFNIGELVDGQEKKEDSEKVGT